jgi:hypothetical protein
MPSTASAGFGQVVCARLPVKTDVQPQLLLGTGTCSWQGASTHLLLLLAQGIQQLLHLTAVMVAICWLHHHCLVTLCLCGAHSTAVACSVCVVLYLCVSPVAALQLMCSSRRSRCRQMLWVPSLLLMRVLEAGQHA